MNINNRFPDFILYLDLLLVLIPHELKYILMVFLTSLEFLKDLRDYHKEDILVIL